MRTVTRLRERGVDLGVTAHNAAEFVDRLTNKFGLATDTVAAEVREVLAPVEIIGRDQYEHLRGAADARLRVGGKSDWPALAAALAVDGAIWSEDVDFFGVGVPVWSTMNVGFFESVR